MGKKTATFIKKIDNDTSDQKLYKMNPPLDGCEYVVVSGVNAMGTGPETYIFGADSKGKIRDWDELDGSFRGSIDHEQALQDAGYGTALPAGSPG